MFNFYGISLSLGIFLSFWLTSRRAERRGLDPNVIWDSLPWVLGFGVFGARLYHVLNFLPYYLNHWQFIPQVWLGGLGIWGAIGGGLVGLLIYFKFSPNVILSADKQAKDLGTTNHKVTIRDASDAGVPALSMTMMGRQISNYLDAAAPFIPLAQAIGRAGNIFNAENLPFAYWEIVTNLLIFIFLILIDSNVILAKAGIHEPGSRIKSGMTKPGFLFFLYLLGYSVTRFFLEFFRADSPWIFGPLTVAQWVSLVVFLISIIFLIKKK